MNLLERWLNVFFCVHIRIRLYHIVSYFTMGILYYTIFDYLLNILEDYITSIYFLIADLA